MTGEYRAVVAEARAQSGHCTVRCVCGKQISTCRCNGPKDVWEVSPCRHEPAPELQIRLLKKADRL